MIRRTLTSIVIGSPAHRLDPQPPADDAVLVHAAGVLERSTSDTLVLLAVGSDDQPVSVGGSAAALWEAFATPRTIAEATRHIVPEGADLESALASIHSVVAHLLDQGLLVAIPPGDGRSGEDVRR